MRFPAVAALVALLAGPSAGGPREDAEKAESDGRWADAVALRRGLFESSGTRSDAAFYWRALEGAGEDARLLEEVTRDGDRFAGWDLPVRLGARALVRAGKPEAGAQRLAGLESPAAKVDRARLLILAGRRDEAARLFAELREVKAPRSGGSALDLWARGHAAREAGAFEDAARLFETAYRESLEFLDARVDLARLFQEKYQENLALEELGDAVKLAPGHPDVHLAAAEIHLESNRLTQADTDARIVLAARPADAGAAAVLATLALIADDPAEAETHLKPVLDRNPNDRRARSLLAAARYLAGDSPGWERERDRVLAQDPSEREIFLDLAHILEMSRRNEEAFALYDAVLARDPGHAGALIAKGLLAMREGDEVHAREWLQKGFDGDPFNIRAYNQLELLDKMDTFASRSTDNFVLRYDAAEDSSLVPLVSRSLEDIYRELVELHGWKPQVPTVVEILPSHDWFSARVTGLPWIGGIPAVCFGDVVAMDSPRTLSGQSNWEEILRHEFGHVLALGMTRKKVPHWFTEGLSVHLERFPRGSAWDENLAAAYEDDELIGLDSLSIGFTRPKSHAQRLLAYQEAGIIVGDLAARHGWEAIPRILLAIGDGETFEAALHRATGESYATLKDRAQRVVRETAASRPVWPSPNRDRPARLLARVKADPTNVSKWERLALAQLQVGMDEDARGSIKKLLELDPANARAKGISGLMLLGDKPREGEPEEGSARRVAQARELLEEAFAAGTRDLPVLHALAERDLADADTAAARGRYERALAVYPEDARARLARARLALAQGDREAARQDYRTLLRTDPTAAEGAVELARLELEDEQGGPAAAALDYAVTVLPLDATVEALRGQAYLRLDREEDAYRLLLRARKLDVRNVEVMVGFADYYLRQGDPEEAIYFADLALKYDPDHPRAKSLRAEAMRP